MSTSALTSGRPRRPTRACTPGRKRAGANGARKTTNMGPIEFYLFDQRFDEIAKVCNFGDEKEANLTPGTNCSAACGG